LSRRADSRLVLAFLSAAAVLFSAGVAQAAGGGASAPGTGDPTSSGYENVAFGSRDLAKGMSGDDVKTLNWLITAISGNGPLNGYFKDPTDARVRSFQAEVGVNPNGVVRRDTRKKLAAQMKSQRATWYGPGLWGRGTACGKVLRPTTIGVANKKLPCGTKVTFAYMGHWVRATVIDRGPYRKGYKWDLTKKLAKRLGFLAVGAGKIKARAIVRPR
jgi:rare lipoprotein A (peptidoglycan hydrolase)